MKLLSKLITTRIRYDCRDNTPMVAIYFCGIFVEAAKLNNETKMFYDIKKEQYFLGL